MFNPSAAILAIQFQIFHQVLEPVLVWLPDYYILTQPVARLNMASYSLLTRRPSYIAPGSPKLSLASAAFFYGLYVFRSVVKCVLCVKRDYGNFPVVVFLFLFTIHRS